MTAKPQHPTRPLELAATYQRYCTDPDSVPAEWRELFSRTNDEARSWLSDLAARGATPRGDAATPPTASAPLSGDARAQARDSIGALKLIRAYRVRGHLEARLDPLELAPRVEHPDLAPATYGFGDADLDRPIYIDGQLGLESATLREILEGLRRDYCGSMGVEFMHMQNPEERTWIQDRIEGAPHRAAFHEQGKRHILERLTASEVFERFLDKKFKGTKRFGLDGCESVLPALEMIVWRAAEHGVEDIIIGMSHRGRLNVLANLMEKPLPAIFSEFQGGSPYPDDYQGAGDVKYHLGTSTDRLIEGNPIHLSLTPNPSHLEAVNPVVVGRVRARQDLLGDTERSRCMGLLLHGDAAFAGQGLVPETLQFCELSGYRTGGTIHVIVNNQIGFTTSPVKGRSSPYCSDVAKMIQAPIIHVNGDDPEAVVRAAGFAVSYRQRFKKDVILDIYGYRRFGHNEADEPAFTQPHMYGKIARHSTTREIYATQLISEGVVTREEVEAVVSECDERFSAAFDESKSYQNQKADWLEGAWSGLEAVTSYDARRGRTGLALETLREIGEAITRVPASFAINRKIERQLRKKREVFESGEGVDWAIAESLAFGSLLREGTGVRLSGEDCGRGTFSHRHAVWVDQESEERYVPLDHVREEPGGFEVLDSPLSEFGVLGFEYGYSVTAPHTLVLWEAQFGDFVNGAQVIIDQFLAAAEEKWLRMSGLVMLLPHGFEGQGPEHSSARLERFLQLCAEDNLQVVNCSTPASYFHVLRRQMHRPFRKPLIVMSPKSLLRHKEAVSTLAAMGPDTQFHRVLACDELPSQPSDATQLVLCSGKVYYDLIEERARRKANNVHILRLEQLYPIPADALVEMLEPYRQCAIVWCQEEPRNMGAWDFLKDVLQEISEEAGCADSRVRYAGRETSAAPATGLLRDHNREQARLIDEALSVGVERVGRLAYRKTRTQQSEGR